MPVRAFATSSFFSPARPLGLQLFSVLEPMAQDRDGTFRRIAEIGYREVELVAALPGPAAEVKASLDVAGLSSRSAVYFPEPAPGLAGLNLTHDLSRIIDDAGVIGLDYAVMAFSPAPPRFGGAQAGEDLGQFFGRITPQLTADDWRWVAERLNATGETLARAGLRLGYHNHDRELARFGNGTALDILLQCTDPALVSFELDVGWVQLAGIDPVALLEAHPGRFRLMHIKEFQVPAGSPGGYPASVPLGTISTDWPAIFQAAAPAGVEAFFVEHEPPFVGPPLDAARESFRFLSGASA